MANDEQWHVSQKRRRRRRLSERNTTSNETRHSEWQPYPQFISQPSVVERPYQPETSQIQSVPTQRLHERQRFPQSQQPDSEANQLQLYQQEQYPQSQQSGSESLQQPYAGSNQLQTHQQEQYPQSQDSDSESVQQQCAGSNKLQPHQQEPYPQSQQSGSESLQQQCAGSKQLQPHQPKQYPQSQSSDSESHQQQYAGSDHPQSDLEQQQSEQESMRSGQLHQIHKYIQSQFAKSGHEQVYTPFQCEHSEHSDQPLKLKPKPPPPRSKPQVPNWQWPQVVKKWLETVDPKNIPEQLPVRPLPPTPPPPPSMPRQPPLLPPYMISMSYYPPCWTNPWLTYIDPNKFYLPTMQAPVLYTNPFEQLRRQQIVHRPIMPPPPPPPPIGRRRLDQFSAANVTTARPPRSEINRHSQLPPRNPLSARHGLVNLPERFRQNLSIGMGSYKTLQRPYGSVPHPKPTTHPLQKEQKNVQTIPKYLAEEQKVDSESSGSLCSKEVAEAFGHQDHPQLTRPFVQQTAADIPQQADPTGFLPYPGFVAASQKLACSLVQSSTSIFAAPSAPIVVSHQSQISVFVQDAESFPSFTAQPTDDVEPAEQDETNFDNILEVSNLRPEAEEFVPRGVLQTDSKSSEAKENLEQVTNQPTKIESQKLLDADSPGIENVNRGTSQNRFLPKLQRCLLHQTNILHPQPRYPPLREQQNIMQMEYDHNEDDDDVEDEDINNDDGNSNRSPVVLEWNLDETNTNNLTKFIVPIGNYYEELLRYTKSIITQQNCVDENNNNNIEAPLSESAIIGKLAHFFKSFPSPSQILQQELEELRKGSVPYTDPDEDPIFGFRLNRSDETKIISNQISPNKDLSNNNWLLVNTPKLEENPFIHSWYANLKKNPFVGICEACDFVMYYPEKSF